ncbi:uroporphyrinogen-III C-methyltransferase, partial [Staphylococcus chromogenes]
ITQEGVNKEAYWAHLAQGPETLCIYMGVKKLPDICALLLRHGKSADTPVALVHLGTTEQQQTEVGTLSTIVERAAHIKNPAMIIVGEVVRLREELSWFQEASLTAIRQPL